MSTLKVRPKLLKGRRASFEHTYHSSTQTLTTTSSCPSLYSVNQTMPSSSTHERLNTVLMKVVRMALDKKPNQAILFHAIGMAVRDLLNADKALLFILDHSKRILYAHILTFYQEETTPLNTVALEEESSSFNDFITSLGRKPVEELVFRGEELSLPVDKGIAGLVARTGQLVNVANVLQDEYFCDAIDKLTGYTTKTVLCVPVVFDGEVHGVLEAINTAEGFFSKMDEHLLQSLALVTGLYLQNTNLHKKCQLLKYKCKVTNDMLVYQRQCSEQHLQKIRSIDTSHINQYDIKSFDVDTSLIPDEIKPHLFVKMISNLAGESLFNKEQILRFALTVTKNYRPNPYHNWNHAFQVAHSMYWILQNCPQHFDEIERVALVVASLCHDLDHRASNNSFLVATKHPLTQLYSSSILENHHFSQTMELLLINKLNIYSQLPDEQYQHVVEMTQKAIIATDLLNFFPNKEELSKVFQTGNFSWTVPRHKDLVICLMMTICDLCTACKSWNIHNKNIQTIFKEFHEQGELEKSLGITPIKMMDRDYKHQMPSFQVDFIGSITEPCCKILKTVLPHVDSLLEKTVNNKIRWKGMVPSN